MPEINGSNNNSLQTMLESVTNLSNNSSTNKSGLNPFPHADAPNSSSSNLTDIYKRLGFDTNSTSSTATANASLAELFKRLGLDATNPSTPANEVKPAVQPQPAPVKKKKKKRGFFSKIGGFFKKVGGFLKKALPIISTIAMFIPGIGTAIGGALKIATAAMGAFDAIKNKNPLGFISSVAGAFTGGIAGKVGGFLDKAKSFLGNTGIGNVVTKGLDFFNKAKDTFTKFTGGLGGKVTDFLTSKGGDLFKNLTSGIGGKLGDFLKSNGADWIKNLAGNAGSKVTGWLNNTVSNLFSKVTQNPTVQRFTNFLNTGIGNTSIGQLLSDLFSAKKG